MCVRGAPANITAFDDVTKLLTSFLHAMRQLTVVGLYFNIPLVTEDLRNVNKL